MTLEKVTNLIAEKKELDPAAITAESTLESLGFDSLDTVELIMAFEEEFGITIEADETLQTVGDLVSLINSLTA
ncbi:MAG: acyl carrier protein [Clostridiales bacterium]